MTQRDPAKTATVEWRPETRLHGSALLTTALLIALAAMLIVVMGCGAARSGEPIAARPPAAAAPEAPAAATGAPVEQDFAGVQWAEAPEVESPPLPMAPEDRPELSGGRLTPPVVEAPERVAARREAERRAAAERERELREREAEIAAREAAVTRREVELTEQAEPIEEIAETATAVEAEPGGDALAQAEPAPIEPPAPPPRVEARLAAGSGFDVEFLSGLSSATSRVGDTFRARVMRDVYDERGILAIPSGSEVVGTVTQAEALRRVGGRAALGLEMTDLVLPSGETAPLAASFLREGRNETGRDAATIGGAAAGGAILGRILDRDSKKRATVIGAILGAAAGTVIAAKTPGQEVEIPAGTVVAIELDRELRLEVPARR
jgi:type IV secretory pathway VirB10-like protein